MAASIGDEELLMRIETLAVDPDEGAARRAGWIRDAISGAGGPADGRYLRA